VSQRRVLPPGEFTVMIPELHATLHGAATWQIQSHVIPEPRFTLQVGLLPLGEFTVMMPEAHATLQGVRIPSYIFKIVFCHILFIFCFLNAGWALTSGDFRIVSDTLVFMLDAHSAVLLRAYIVHICPVLENNHVVWSPHLKQDTDRTGKVVQRRFTKQSSNLRYLLYNYRLSVSDLPTLELMRLPVPVHVNLIWCYKIAFNLVCLLNCISLSTTQYPLCMASGHPYKLYKKHCNSNVQRNYFSNSDQCVKLQFTDDFCTLYSFKGRLHQRHLTISRD